MNSTVFNCQAIRISIGSNAIIQIVGRNNAINSRVIDYRINVTVIVTISCVVVPTYIAIIINAISVGRIVVVMKRIVSGTRNIISSSIRLRSDCQSASQC